MWVRFLLKNAKSCSLFILVTINYHPNLFITQIFSGNLAPLPLKIKFENSKWATYLIFQDGRHSLDLISKFHPFFTGNWVKIQTFHLYHLQITLKSIDNHDFKLKLGSIFSKIAFEILKWVTLHNPISVKSLAHLVFRLFGWDYDVSARLWCHYKGIPCQKLGKPPKNCDFGQFCLVMCIPITKLNVTIPVLFKTSIKASPHPLSSPPSPPHHQPPFPTLLAPPPCPFLQTLTPNNLPPQQK